MTEPNVIDTAPEQQPAQPEFIDSAQSVDALLASARPAGMPPEATAMRLFAFRPEGTTERLALAFVGPEAERLAFEFIKYAEALFDYIESKRGTSE